MFDDDDAKRRRNLVAYSVAVCLTAVLGIDISAMLESFIKARPDTEPWRLLAAGLAVLGYLTWRFAVRSRDDTKDKPSDRQLVTGLVSERLQLIQGHWLEKTYGHKTIDLAACKISRWFVRNWARKIADSIKNSDAAPISISIQDVGTSDMGATAVFMTVRADLADGGTAETAQVRMAFSEVGPITYVWVVRAWASALFASKQTVDVFLPYWLALAAAAVLIWKYCVAIGMI